LVTLDNFIRTRFSGRSLLPVTPVIKEKSNRRTPYFNKSNAGFSRRFQEKETSSMSGVNLYLENQPEISIK
jgi:hypothetical protein